MRKIISRSSLLCLSFLIAFLPGYAGATQTDKQAAAELNVSANQQEKANDKNSDVADKPKKEPEASRGKMLYSNHCHACHESNIHIRAQRKVKKKSDIGYWVNRWSTHLKLNWKQADRQQVIDYLNQTYYKFSTID